MGMFWRARRSGRKGGGQWVPICSVPELMVGSNKYENLKSEPEADVMEESVKLGPIDSVKICENHPQGVVLVKFKDRTDAEKCIQLMNGRWFAGRQVHTRWMMVL